MNLLHVRGILLLLPEMYGCQPTFTKHVRVGESSGIFTTVGCNSNTKMYLEIL